MVTARWIAVALLLVAFAAKADDTRPAFVVLSDGTLGVTLPGTAFADEEVKKQLKSGLTTTFVALATAADRSRSAARVEVRYDLWDEKYVVRRIDADASVMRVQFSTLEDLARWWRATPMRLLRKGTREGRVDLELRVLPFSAAEERDTRDWLSKGGGSLGGSGARASDGAAAVPSMTVIQALIGTSLEARPLLTFHWRVELTTQGGR